MGLQIDRPFVCRGVLGIVIFAGAASAQPEVPDALFVIVQNSIRVAGLTSAEIRQIMIKKQASGVSRIARTWTSAGSR
jgi:hypothetical protein